MEPLIECGFFFLGGGESCRWLLQRPGVDFECSWDGLCWVLLVSLGCGMDYFGSALRIDV